MSFEQKLKDKIQKHEEAIQAEKKALDSLQYALSIYRQEDPGLTKTKDKPIKKRGRPKTLEYVKPKTSCEQINQEEQPTTPKKLD